MKLVRAGVAMRLALSRGATSALATLLAAAAGPSFAQLDTELEPGTSGARQRLSLFLEEAARAGERLEAIQQEESANGPYSAALVDQLQSLALLYHEIGEDDLAVESIQKALQVGRANFGLYSLDQVPLIRQLIEAERGVGNTAAVTELEGRLLRLAYYHPDDLRSAEILRTSGERYLEIYSRYLAGDLPPEITIDIGFVGASRPPPRKTFVVQAQQRFTEAIGVLLRNGSYGAEALHELEQKLVYTYYLELTQGDPLPFRVEAISSLGEQAHERMLAYHTLNDGTVEDIARALVELADWQLFFSQNSTALDGYREVYEMLAGHAEHEALLADLLAPDRPVVIPAFAPSPLAGDGSKERHYVDVSFDISRYGKTRNISVIGASSDVAENEARDVVRLIARSRFRPRLRDGEPMRPSSVRVRYGF